MGGQKEEFKTTLNQFKPYTGGTSDSTNGRLSTEPVGQLNNSNNGLGKVPTGNFKPMTNTATGSGQTGSKFSGNGLFKSSIYGN